nr:SIS domain-containing protein [Methylobacterium durans]
MSQSGEPTPVPTHNALRMNGITPKTGPSQSHMAREIAEIPQAAARLWPGSGEAERVAATLSRRSFPLVVLCGRGSSGHAGIALRYLIETRLGLPVSASAPSIVTGYEHVPRVAGALFIVVSQSGRSPDLVAATEAAKAGGALTLALVNDAASPVARAAELVLPLDAGPERAVAATKTVVNSFVLGAALVARWAGDRALADGLAALPDRLGQALALDWSAWSADLAAAPAAFVTGRGHGLGTVREIALKLAETLRLPALGYSAAELRHGPAPRSAPPRPCSPCARPTRPRTGSTVSSGTCAATASPCTPAAGRTAPSPGCRTDTRPAIRS